MPSERDLWFGPAPQEPLGLRERLCRGVGRAGARRSRSPRRARAVVREAFIQGVIFGFLLAAVAGYALVSALHG
jgi:hypothetical protein